MNSGLVRNFLRQVCLTPNTIRYVLEYRCITRAFEPLPRGGVLLDAGAGSGAMSLKLFRAGYCSRLIGVEPFAENYRLLASTYAASPAAETHLAGLEDLPLPDNSVDYILSTQVLEHIVDHRRAASEMVRVTKPGGYLVISVPHPPERLPNPEHVRPGYTEKELTELFAPWDLEHMATDYYFTLATQRRVLAALELPLHGIYLPIGWADREKSLTFEERRQAYPGALLCVFRKRSSAGPTSPPGATVK